ncbi:MAG: methylenetetrahydrofolate reductase [Dehalococcoidia bacterium]|nr:methylenetetrahydrofolate reductase [Dehalococcoidia bacterium]
MNTLFGTPYLIELLTPKQDDADFEARLEVFAERYQRILDAGAVVSIPDNPMGNVHFTALEVMDFLELPMDPERTLLHLNSFHLKSDMDAFLRTAADRGLHKLLVISGDGGPRLPRLEPADIRVEDKTVTSIVLLGYIEREYPGVFTCGVAFNQYEPPEHELERLRWKIDAGARFAITQPVLGNDPTVASLVDFEIPIFAGAWMSKRIDLLMQCVDREPEPDMVYSPDENLALLDRTYPEFGLYLALLGFKRDWAGLFTRMG